MLLIPEDLLKLATRFHLGQDKDYRDIVVERRSYPNDPEMWAILADSMCLSKDGKWDYEPMPSNRSDEFIENHRWNNLDEAVRIAEKLVV